MIRDFVPEDFDRVFEIIEESFPRDEHGTYEEHKKLLSDPAYKIYILALIITITYKMSSGLIF